MGEIEGEMEGETGKEIVGEIGGELEVYSKEELSAIRARFVVEDFESGGESERTEPACAGAEVESRPSDGGEPVRVIAVCGSRVSDIFLLRCCGDKMRHCVRVLFSIADWCEFFNF